jgi:type IV pilus assembly protein PilV
MNKIKNDRGFSLIEALIAIFVLTIGVFSLYSMQITSLMGNNRAITITSLADWSSSQIERLMSLPYDDPLLNDTQPAQGLAANTVANSDSGAVNSPDGRYTMFWNVAIDAPMQNTKTIQVFALDNQLLENGVPYLSTVVFQYVKNGNI